MANRVKRQAEKGGAKQDELLCDLSRFTGTAIIADVVRYVLTGLADLTQSVVDVWRVVCVCIVRVLCLRCDIRNHQ